MFNLFDTKCCIVFFIQTVGRPSALLHMLPSIRANHKYKVDEKWVKVSVEEARNSFLLWIKVCTSTSPESFTIY